jgi:hypothetical protein
MAQLTLTVSTDDGNLHLVALSADSTVQDLSEQLWALTSVPPPQQALFHNGSVLLASKRLSDCGIVDGDLLSMSLRRPAERAQRPVGLQGAAFRTLADGSAADPAAFQAALRAEPSSLANVDPQTRIHLLGSLDEMQARCLLAQRRRPPDSSRSAFACSGNPAPDAQAARRPRGG